MSSSRDELRKQAAVVNSNERTSRVSTATLTEIETLIAPLRKDIEALPPAVANQLAPLLLALGDLEADLAGRPRAGETTRQPDRLDRTLHALQWIGAALRTVGTMVQSMSNQTPPPSTGRRLAEGLVLAVVGGLVAGGVVLAGTRVSARPVQPDVANVKAQAQAEQINALWETAPTEEVRAYLMRWWQGRGR